MQLKKDLKTGRNELCSCGSGKKYKKCCLKKQRMQTIQQNEIRRTIKNVSKQKESVKGEGKEKEIIQESVKEPCSAEEGNN